MPTATKNALRAAPAAPQPLTRRQWLARLGLFAAACGALPSRAQPRLPAGGARLFAAWQSGAGYRIGVLAQQGKTITRQAELQVPTRAHGVWHERHASASPSFLAVARRPGDWLVRWRADGTAPQWQWAEPDRALNGHVIASTDGKRLFTTETDLQTGQGLIGVRDAATLHKLAEWPTQGMDPHELLLDRDGHLMVANGGIPTQPETGRLKLHLDRMDSSLARLDSQHGTLLGQWRLPDSRLSLRHMAWSADQRTLGIALQAEHDEAVRKQHAPVLALFDGRALAIAVAPGPLSGYGGDIAFDGTGFAVSCPRSAGVALFSIGGTWRGFAALDDACALAAGHGQADAPGLWAAGLGQALVWPTGDRPLAATLPPSVRLDNHWLAWG